MEKCIFGTEANSLAESASVRCLARAVPFIYGPVSSLPPSKIHILVNSCANVMCVNSAVSYCSSGINETQLRFASSTEAIFLFSL